MCIFKRWETKYLSIMFKATMNEWRSNEAAPPLNTHIHVYTCTFTRWNPKEWEDREPLKYMCRSVISCRPPFNFLKSKLTCPRLIYLIHRKAIIVLSLSLFSQTVCNIQTKEEIIMQDWHFSENDHYYYSVSVFIELFFPKGRGGGK